MEQRKFFKDKERAKAFCKEVNGSLHYKGSSVYKIELEDIEYSDGLEEFDYLVLWGERKINFGKYNFKAKFRNLG